MTYNESDTCWHLLCRTEGGKVSMLKNLDAPTARQAYQRLKPDSRPARYLNMPESGASWSGACYGSDAGRITNVDILGPEGCELDPWRAVEPRYYDMGGDLRFGPRPLPPEIGRKLAAEEDAQSERIGA